MTDADQTVESDLVSMKGWLLLYAILLALRTAFLLGIVLLGMQWGYISDVTERLIGILALTVFLVALYLLIVVRRPITRYYHIGLNCFFAAIFAWMAILTLTLGSLATCAGHSIWAVYWIRSKRVRATYCQDAASVS